MSKCLQTATPPPFRACQLADSSAPFLDREERLCHNKQDTQGLMAFDEYSCLKTETRLRQNISWKSGFVCHLQEMSTLPLARSAWTFLYYVIIMSSS
jgi:hypothetical protein